MKEYIAQNYDEALALHNYGVKHIELISEWTQGGLTPDVTTLSDVSKIENFGVEVMVRPHGESFVYDEQDKEKIKETIYLLQELGYKHIVFGCLNEDNNIDLNLLKDVISWKGDMKITFHRAIELTNNFLESVKQISELGCDYILTSGRGDTFELELKSIEEANDFLVDKKTEIIFGGGINEKNFAIINAIPGLKNFHIGTGIRDINNNILLDKIDFFGKE